MLVEFADVVELGGNLPNKQLGIRSELSPFVAALVVGFVKVDFVKPRFLGGQPSIMRGSGSLPRIRFHDNSHTVVGNLVSVWLIDLPHSETNQVGSLGIDPVTIDLPGSIGDAGGLGIVHVYVIVIRVEEWP